MPKNQARGNRPVPELSRQREAVAWELRLKGWGITDTIAELERRGLGRVCTGAVHKMIVRVRARCIAETDASVRAWQEEQVRQYTLVYRKAMDGFERSCEDARLVRERERAAGPPIPASTAADGAIVAAAHQPTERWMEVRGQAGDPSFLMAAMKALEQIRKVLGFEPAEKKDGAGEGPVLNIVIKMPEGTPAETVLDVAPDDDGPAGLGHERGGNGHGGGPVDYFAT